MVHFILVRTNSGHIASAKLPGLSQSTAPRLPPRLIVYLNHHPALSYWFAPVYVGGYSQAPRTDESVLESFNELQVALQLPESTFDPTASWCPGLVFTPKSVTLAITAEPRPITIK